jgi:transcriptional regulator with XRE-family HTH domain
VKNRIGVLRKARRLSLEALAEKVGTTNQQISFLENGKRRLTVDWLVRLAEALACHPWEIISHNLPGAPSPKDVQLLDRFQKMSSAQQDALLKLLEAFPSGRRSPGRS